MCIKVHLNEKIGNDFSVLVGAACANMNMLLKMHKYPGRRTETRPICETTIKLLLYNKYHMKSL